MRPVALGLFAALVLPRLALASAQTVVVEGVAAVVDGDVPIARDRALDDAKRKAVEQVAGTEIRSRTVTESFQLVEDEILARASGFVEAHRILDEAREGDVYRVRIEARVHAEALAEDLSALLGSKPRVIVLVAEQNIGSDRPEAWWGSSGASADLSLFTNALVEAWQPRGYTFVDPELLAGELKVRGPMRSPELSNAAARKLARGADADVAVIGQVLVNDAGPVMEGVRMRAYHAVGTLRVLGVDTGEILAVADDTGVAAHVDPNLGGRLAIKALAKKVGGALESKLVGRWTKETSSREVQLELVGRLSGAEARLVERGLLDRVRGVERVKTRRRTKGRAFLTVQVRARVEDFARDLEAQRFGELGLALTDVSARRIVAELDRGAR